MTWWMRVALGLYPAAWRRRYGAELEQLVRDSGGGARSALDIARAGLSLRLDPWRETLSALVRAPFAMGALTPHLRRLRAAPAFTVTVIATLALAIGANTAVFAFVNEAFLKPLPFEAEDRLVAVLHVAPGMAPGPINQAAFTYFTYRDEATTLDDLALWAPQNMTITGADDPIEVEALTVTSGLLPVLRLTPAAGRFFASEDDQPGARPTVVIAHDYWTSTLGGSVAALGTTITIDGRPHEIIGVLPQGFRLLSHAPRILVPLRLDRATTQIGLFRYQGVARLKPGVTIAQASADLARLIPTMPDRFPIPQGFSRRMYDEFHLAPEIHPLRDDVAGGARSVLWILLGAVLALMAVACANGASLFLVRGEVRRQEFVVQLALGSGLGRVAGSILGEAAVVSALGGALGVAVGMAGLRALTSVMPPALPFAATAGIDGATVLFGGVLSLIAALVFSLGPLAAQSRSDLAATLREGGRGGAGAPGRQRVWAGLVVAQVALTFVLLIGSTLLIRSLILMRDVDPGFKDPSRVLTARIAIPEAVLSDPVATARAHQAILERIAAIRGVEFAGQSSSVTMEGVRRRDSIFAEGVNDGDGTMPLSRRMKWTTPGYFATLGNSIVAGRDFRWEDIHDMRGVSVVTLNIAKELFGSAQAAIGRRVRPAPRGPWREIVGVVGDEHDDGPALPATPTVYWPILQNDYVPSRVSVERSLVYVIRTARVNDPALLGEIQRAVWSIQPSVPISRIATLDAIASRNVGQVSLTMNVLVLTAGVTFALGMVGLYGVVASLVAHRHREIAVRMALGARGREVQAMFLRRGLAIVSAGLAIGAAAAAYLTRGLGELLFGVALLDPLTYAASAALLVVAGAMAVWVPSRGASALAPAAVLRS